jgi:sugar phosphate permease
MARVRLKTVFMNSRLRSLVIGNSIFIFGGSLLVPVYALFTQSLGASIRMTGILFASKFVANALADIVVMRYHHKLPSSTDTYRISMAVRGAAWVCVGLYPSVLMLLAVQIVTGLAEGFGTPAFSLLMANNLDKGKDLKQWATWDLIKNPLIAISTTAGAWLVAGQGFALIFYLMGGMAIAAAFVPFGKTRRRKPKVVQAAYQLLFASR